jgi:hypothetical protein
MFMEKFMRKVILLVSICLFFTSPANASGNGEKIFDLESTPVNKTSEASLQRTSKSKPEEHDLDVRGNLPAAYSVKSRQSIEQISTVTVLPQETLKSVLKLLEVGSDIEIRIGHSVIAFPDEKAPVIASIEEGPLRNWRLIGESRLETNTRRIFIDFKMIVNGGKAYRFKGETLSISRQPGFEGEYHSRETTYFVGDFISSVTSAYFDGLIPRNSNAFGQVQADTSVDSAFKKGLAGGAMSSADRFKEKLKKVPEFSELQGPIRARVLILDKAIEI